jgi:hypothetical protein
MLEIINERLISIIGW